MWLLINAFSCKRGRTRENQVYLVLFMSIKQVKMSAFSNYRGGFTFYKRPLHLLDSKVIHRYLSFPKGYNHYKGTALQTVSNPYSFTNKIKVTCIRLISDICICMAVGFVSANPNMLTRCSIGVNAVQYQGVDRGTGATGLPGVPDRRDQGLGLSNWYSHRKFH